MVAEMSLLLNVAVEPYEESIITENERKADTQILNIFSGFRGYNILYLFQWLLKIVGISFLIAVDLPIMPRCGSAFSARHDRRRSSQLG